MVEAFEVMGVFTGIVVLIGFIYFGSVILIWWIGKKYPKTAPVVDKLLYILDFDNFKMIWVYVFIVIAIFLSGSTPDNVYDEYRSVDNRGYFEP